MESGEQLWERRYHLDSVWAVVKGKQNGRGAYLCFSAECLQKARRSKGLERSLKISIPDEIYDRLEEELKELDTKQ